jgi:hypothetical protein
MNFTVTWHRESREELARLWLAAPNRRELSTAADAIDRELSRDAHLKGEDFYGDRLFVSAPLAVVYMVSVDDCRVEVLDVWRG